MSRTVKTMLEDAVVDKASSMFKKSIVTVKKSLKEIAAELLDNLKSATHERFSTIKTACMEIVVDKPEEETDSLALELIQNKLIDCDLFFSDLIVLDVEAPLESLGAKPEVATARTIERWAFAQPPEESKELIFSPDRGSQFSAPQRYRGMSLWLRLKLGSIDQTRRPRWQVLDFRRNRLGVLKLAPFPKPSRCVRSK